MAKNNNKSKKQLRVYLSKEDYDVPNTHISLHKLLVANPSVRDVYGINVAEKVREQTFKAVRDLYQEYGAKSYKNFWNHHVQEITELGLNRFAQFDDLKPFCNCIECFEKKIQGKSEPYIRISFGISHDYVIKYYEIKKECEAKGKKFAPPKLKRYSPRQKNFSVDFGNDAIKIDKQNIADVPRNALYRQFEKWRTLQGLDRTDAFLIAMESAIKLNPVEYLEDVNNFNIITVFDRKMFVNRSREVNREAANLKVDSEILKSVEAIVYRYNCDPKNHNRSPLKISEYIESAINQFNKNMPLKYLDPKLYDETMTVVRQNEQAKQLESGDYFV